MKLFTLTACVACGAFLAGCSSITMVRTKEMRAVGEDVKQNADSTSAALRAQVDSLHHVIDSLYAQQDLVNKRLKADLSLLAQRVSDESDRNDSRQEEVLYRLDLLLGKSDKILAKKVVVNGQAVAPMDSASIDAATAEEMGKIATTAHSDYSRGEYKLAYSGFKQVYEQVKTGPQAEEALYWMGVCLMDAQQTDKAKKIFAGALETFPDGAKSCQILYKLSSLAAVEGDVAVQKQYLQKLLGEKQCSETNEFQQAAETLEGLLNAETTEPKAAAPAPAADAPVAPAK